MHLFQKWEKKLHYEELSFFENSGLNFSYVHNSLEKNVGKVVSIVQLSKNSKKDLKDLGSKLAMHI